MGQISTPELSAGELLLLGGVVLGGQQKCEPLSAVWHEACGAAHTHYGLEEELSGQ